MKEFSCCIIGPGFVMLPRQQVTTRGELLFCRKPRRRARATSVTIQNPIPVVYYGAPILNNEDRVLPDIAQLPIIVAINCEAKVLSQTSIPLDILVFRHLPPCHPSAPLSRAHQDQRVSLQTFLHRQPPIYSSITPPI